MIFTFGSELPVGEGQLHLEFTGELNDKMKGFYRSNYTTPSGEKRVCAVTQFEVGGQATVLWNLSFHMLVFSYLM